MARNKAYVASVGFTKIGDHWESSLLDLAVEAGRKALKGAPGLRPQQLFVGNMFSSVAASQEHLGALLANALGLTGIPAMKVESACSSGASAFNVAYSMVRTGAIDSALVVGVEKMRDMEGESVSKALCMAESAEWTQFVGATFASLNALLARRYVDEMNVSRDELSAIPVIDHTNGVAAEHAQFRKAITPEVVARSAMIADPLRLFDCAPTGDGAAAALLVNDNAASSQKTKMVEVLGGSVRTAEFSVYQRKDMLRFGATEEAFKIATEMAGVSPKKLKFAEIHDAFSATGALCLEAMGFSKRGMGAKDAAAGKYNMNSELSINTFGGLKARGHPVGATGMYEISEAYLQLTDQAGKNQVKDADFGVTQNVGGVDTTSAVHIFGRAG
jgi:acetyl-CoA acetyltransferase